MPEKVILINDAGSVARAARRDIPITRTFVKNQKHS